jgi:hypothetical protein
MLLRASRISCFNSNSLKKLKYFINLSTDEGAFISEREWIAAAFWGAVPEPIILKRWGIASSFPIEAEASMAARLTSCSSS